MGETSGQRDERFDAILKEMLKPLTESVRKFFEGDYIPSKKIIAEFDVKKEYQDTEIYNANAINQMANMILETTEQEQQLINEIKALIGVPTDGDVEIIVNLFGERTPEFVFNENVDGLYAIQISLDEPLEKNTVYTIVIDEGSENETSEKLFTTLNEDSGMLVAISSNPNQNNIALMQVADNEYILASLDGTLVGPHTIKLLKDTNDMSESYVVRLFDKEKLDIVAMDLSTDKSYTISIINSSGASLYSNTEVFETTSGMLGAVDYDFDRGETYEVLSSGEECTLQIVDNSDNSVVISSSNVVRSQVTFMGGTICECYCWGNENIIPYTSFGT